MSEENIDYNAILTRFGINKQLAPDTSDHLARQMDQEVLAVAEEFLEKVRPIIATRNKIKKASDDLVQVLSEVSLKLTELIVLKNANAEQEREVLQLLKQELLRS